MIFGAAILAMLLQTPGSLFGDSAPNLFLFRDFKARSIGDILTIQVNESSTATNSANTSTARTALPLSMPASRSVTKATVV